MNVRKGLIIMRKNKKNASNRYMPTKNYILTALIIVFIIFLTFYIIKWYQVKTRQNIQDHYLITSNTISLEIDEYDEIDNILTESPSFYFVYVSYTNDKDTYNLEKKIKPLIDEHNLINNFYLIDATNMLKDKDYLTKINEKLNITKKKITKLPVILYFENNELISKVDNAKDFEALIKIQDIDELSR